LPSERRLSEELQAGRHAVREALKRLQQSGLIRISQGGATRVRDWRHEGGLDLLLELGETTDPPPELNLEQAVLEMRASIGADAARLCATRASAVQRAEIIAEAERLAVAEDRYEIYERLWARIVDGAENIAYRLALNTLVAGQRVLELDAAMVADELRDARAVRELTQAIAAGDAQDAHAKSSELLGRST
jgi:GntR family transcriptional regulator, transcriptional repressor for pyruvate dehydrogenase complex